MIHKTRNIPKPIAISPARSNFRKDVALPNRLPRPLTAKSTIPGFL